MPETGWRDGALPRGRGSGEIAALGRWASERTLVHYLQEATAFLIRNRLSPESCFLLKTLVTEGAFLLEPPRSQLGRRA